MSLQLNNPVIDFKEFYGPNNAQMPLLIADGRVPMSAAGLMARYLEVLKLHSNAPKQLKPAYAKLLSAWGNSYFDTGDGSVRASDGMLKVVPDAHYLRVLTPNTPLVNGTVDLSAEYAQLPGEEFSRNVVDKYCGMSLSRGEAKKNPVWLALARGDKALLRDFVDARFSQTKERFDYDGKMMGVYASPAPKEGAFGRLWCVNRLNDNINNSRANGNNHLDNNNGRLVGIGKLNLLGQLIFVLFYFILIILAVFVSVS